MVLQLKTNANLVFKQIKALNNKYNDKNLKDITKEWNSYLDFISEQDSYNKISVIVTGLVKAGKSSFLNSLFNEDEKFPTGAVRKTMYVQQNSWNQGNLSGIEIIFVDTPGIDANEIDEDIAEEAIRKSHLILFVHNINSGELDSKEMKYLLSLKQDIPDLNFRIIFVLTHTDLKDDKEIENIIEKIKNQLHKYLEIDNIKIFSTSSTRYFNGIEKKKDLLIEKSNIPSFKIFLQKELENKLDVLKKVPLERYKQLKSKTKNILKEINQKISLEINNKQQNIDSTFKKISNFQKRWKENINSIPEQVRITCIKEETRDIYKIKPEEIKPSKTDGWF